MNDMTVHEVWQQYDVSPFSDTQLWVRDHDHTCGIFDTVTGSFTVPVACKLGKYLTSSLRLLSIGDKCGVYDTKHGRRMLSIGYDTIDDFRETNIVSEGLRPACITNYMPWVQRRELGEAPVQDADDHRHVSSLLFRVRLGARWGVFDPKKIEFIVPIIYDKVARLTDSLIQLWMAASTGLFDTSHATMVLPVTYDDIDILTNARVRVRTGDKVGIFDTLTGRFEVPISFGNVAPITDILYLVQSDGRCGMFDSIEGALVVPEQFDQVEMATDSLFRVRVGTLWGMFDVLTREFVVPIAYQTINRLSDSQFKVTSDDFLCGVYSSKTGRLIVPTEYQDVVRLTETLFEVHLGPRRGLFNTITHSAIDWK